MILSVSQVDRFDETQSAGCPRAWWFERVRWLRPEQTAAQGDGEAGHALLAAYLATGALPGKRVKMGKMVTGAIVKGDLPKPGSDLVIEQRFDGTPRPAPGVPWPDLDLTETLHLGGVPWDGFIDVAFRRGEIPEVWDHKFFTPARPDVSPDPYAYLKKSADLIKTVQMPVYVLSQRPYWPDAKLWRIVHHCVSRSGVDSKIRAAVVHIDQVLEQAARIEGVVRRIQEASKADQQTEVPFNRRACSAFSGCPHQSICSAFKEKNTVQLTPEEAALFADFDSPTAEAPAPATQHAPAPAVDEVAELKRKLAEAEAKATAAKPARRLVIVDESTPTPTPGAAPVPQPTLATTPTEVCACGEKITAENGSRMQSGEWKHIGCKLNAPPAPTPEPKKRKPKAETPAQAPVATPAPVAAPAPVPVAPKAEPAVGSFEVGPIHRSDPAPKVAPSQSPDRNADAREALATTLENIAKLIRSVA